MRSRSKLTVLVWILLVCFAYSARGRNADFYLKNGDRVLFYGDSITEQSFYTNYVETYVLTRFPNLKIDFVNSGWSGDRVYGGGGGGMDERLTRDVYPHRPAVMTIMFGMNDGCYVEFNADCYKGFAEGYERLLSLLKKDSPDLRITLLQPSPFDDLTDSNSWRLASPVKGGYNTVLLRYSEFVGELARKNNLSVADMNAPLVETIEKAQKIDREQAQKIIPDRIHPSNAGGLLMANVLLKTWNAPAVVSAVEIDAKAKKLVRGEKTKISGLRSNEAISWMQTDESLPMPIDLNDKTIKFVAEISDAVESLNQEILKVTNLSAARYRLKIDGEEIGFFAKEELAKGINLAVFQTPMLKQSMAVHHLTERHNKIHFVRWREIQVPFEKENSARAAQVLNALDQMEAELINKQRSMAQPKPHRYELVAAN